LRARASSSKEIFSYQVGGIWEVCGKYIGSIWEVYKAVFPYKKALLKLNAPGGLVIYGAFPPY
jgi:hypothetical protein